MMKSCNNFQTYISIFQRMHHTFLILGFLRGNWPKMSLKYAIFKNCLKLATKSGVCFWIWASKVPFFGTRKRPILVLLGQKKLDFRCPNLKTETTFCRQLFPKMMEQTLVSHEYHFRASFRQILKIVYFRLIFGLFPIVKL